MAAKLSKASETYLTTLGVSPTVRRRIDYFWKLYAGLLPEGVAEHIFLCDVIGVDGSRTYTSLWIYGSTFAAECKNFLFAQDFDGASVNKIALWAFDSEDFEPGKPASSSSRLSLSWTTEYATNGVLTATGENCDALMHYFRTCVLPNQEASAKVGP
ncbi:MAG: hypothetical protein QOH69_1525 [Actinomycetota bacterium]|jgi:hypothetical protein|nr:hypothetical protein [Actinomycetota bacterium]